MFRRSASLILVLFVIISFILQCDLPQDPADPSNTRVELIIRNSHWLQSNSLITDTVDHPIQIGLVISLPENIDSIKLSVKAEGKVIFDTLLKTFSPNNKDTIWKSMTFPDTGYKLVSMVPFSNVVKLLPVSAEISIVKKSILVQSVNNAPKWKETTLNVALSDTARYELNLSPLCSDPNKDILQYAIAGKPMPGDTIVDSMYVFQASSLTVGKNSIELIASDPAGLNDTMELILIVTTAGTDNSPPEVTIISPAQDSGVTNAENYVVDMICSDASGIDSVYAVFNGTTTHAVLENGHYKINITGLVAGVYNIIQLTVREKSINALKTTKTIKIKYTQGFTIAYNGNGNLSGIIPIDTGKYENGATATVKGNTGNLVKTDFTFAGWNTAADGSGTAYAAGSTFNMGTGNVTLFARWTQNPTFTVTYDGNTSTAGTVPSDAGKYETGSPVTVKGNTGNLVKTGFTFAGWNTVADGSGTAYAAGSTYTMGTANITLFARWTQNSTFTVTYNGNASTTGTIPTDEGKYETGSSVTVKTNTGNLIKTGFTFAGWNTAADGSGTAYAVGSTFAMGTGNVTLFARWTQNATFTVTYNGNTNTSGAVPTDPGKYETGATVTVKSNAGNLVKTGFTFVGWATSATGTEVYKGEETLKIGTSDVILYAIWKQNTTYTLTITSTNGQVTISPNATVFDSGTIVTLTPVPSANYHFSGWSGALSGTANPATITMNGAKTVTASFEANAPNTFTLTVLAPNGTVQKAPDQPQYDSGSIVALTAVPNAGYQFTGWSGALTGTTNPSSVTMNAAKSITANFAIKTYGLTITATNGSVTKLPNSNSYDSGTVVTLTAVPDAGYQFTGWGGGLTGTTNPSSVTMNAAKNVTANFALKSFALSITATNGSVTKLPDANSYDSGTVVTLTAVPNAGYQFTGWSGGLTGTTNPSSVTMNAAKSVTANFALKTFALSISATNGSVTKLPNANSYDSGTVVTLTAVPDAGYQFTGWSGALTGTTNPASVTINAVKSVTANFALKTFALSITATNGSVSKSPNANSYDSGTVVMLTAVPNTGYQFNGWTGGLTGTINPASVTMNAAKSVTANFVLNTYQLTILPGTGGSITTPATSTVTVNHGVATSIIATPATGYQFSNWSVILGSASIANQNSASTTVSLTSGSATVQANFTLTPYQLYVTSSAGTISKPTTIPASVTPGSSVAIQVDFNSSDFTFVNWTVTSGSATFIDASLSNTYVIPSSNATVRANLSPVLKATLSPETQINAWGQLAQTITSTVTGGTPPYTYSWKCNASDILIFESTYTPYYFPAGTYEYYIEVTDAKGAKAISNISKHVITEAVTEW